MYLACVFLFREPGLINYILQFMGILENVAAHEPQCFKSVRICAASATYILKSSEKKVVHSFFFIKPSFLK